MPIQHLPDNICPTADTLRALWHKYPDDAEVHNAILELVRMRQLLEDVEGYRSVIESCWRQDVGGKLVALDNLGALVSGERSRLGRTSAPPPAPPGSADRLP